MIDLRTRDGSFVVIFSGAPEKLEEMEFLLGCNPNDNLFELLGGGFDLSDVTPDVAAQREVFEETSKKLFIEKARLSYFAHMTQRLPRLGENEKGSVFCFFYEHNKDCSFDLVPSCEHSVLAWHKLSDIISDGEKIYRTSTLRIIFHFLNYLSSHEFHFGILREKIVYMGYQF
jgi:8-oxo-dGTP pyrophosphatase MutT (NUDIX family)